MTVYKGVNGTKNTSKNNGNQPFGVNGGYIACFAKDFYAVPTAFGDGDWVYLGAVRSDAYLDKNLSELIFDDMGTGITVAVGTDPANSRIVDALGENSLASLATGIDVATAAGKSSLLAGVATADLHKPLWQQLNLAEDPHMEIPLYAKFTGNPGTGNLSWTLAGS